MVILSLVICVL